MNPDDRLRISLHGFGADGRLTEAFRNPAVLPNDTNRIINIERFAIRAPNSINLEGQNAIVIRKIFDKTKIAWFLGFLLMISPSVGLVVGLTTHNVGAGVTASVGVFALASCVQGLATWFHT